MVLIGESNVRRGLRTGSERATHPTRTDEAGAEPPRRQPRALSTDQSLPSKPTCRSPRLVAWLTRYDAIAQPWGLEGAAICRRDPPATLTCTVPKAGASARRSAAARRAAGGGVPVEASRWHANAAGEKPVSADARARASPS